MAPQLCVPPPAVAPGGCFCRSWKQNFVEKIWRMGKERHPGKRVQGEAGESPGFYQFRKRTLDLQGKGEWGTVDSPCLNLGETRRWGRFLGSGQERQR